jgi:hypothetical protein
VLFYSIVLLFVFFFLFLFPGLFHFPYSLFVLLFDVIDWCA